jgi:hypothetical protein
MNLGIGTTTTTTTSGQPYFTIGILSNDDVRARAVLGIFLGIPPIFHKRSEITLIEGKWRTDSGAVMRFAPNVYSVFFASPMGHESKVYQLKFEPPADVMASLKPNLDGWWNPAEDEKPG